MSDEIKRQGVTRVADNERALLVLLSRRPTDEEMRNIDEALDPGHQRYGEVKGQRDAYAVLLMALHRRGRLGNDVHDEIRRVLGVRTCGACGRETAAPGDICGGCLVEGRLSP